VLIFQILFSCSFFLELSVANFIGRVFATRFLFKFYVGLRMLDLIFTTGKVFLAYWQQLACVRSLTVLILVRVERFKNLLSNGLCKTRRFFLYQFRFLCTKTLINRIRWKRFTLGLPCIKWVGVSWKLHRCGEKSPFSRNYRPRSINHIVQEHRRLESCNLFASDTCSLFYEIASDFQVNVWIALN